MPYNPHIEKALKEYIEQHKDEIDKPNSLIGYNFKPFKLK